MIARINKTALSKEATVPQFDCLSFSSVSGRYFRLRLSWLVFLPLGLFSALLLFIHLTVSYNF